MSEKSLVMSAIRKMAKTAATHRLRGNINKASECDRALDAIVARAEAKGWADDALQAEEDGRMKARG